MPPQRVHDLLEDRDAGLARPGLGVSLDVDGGCWTHVHPHEGNVFDFSEWAVTHPGNAAAANKGLSNPITRSAKLMGLAELHYPSHAGHTMSRWSSFYKKFPRLGRLGGAWPAPRTLSLRRLPDPFA